VVDVANVMGARADGWWRDRGGAALRLGREVIGLSARPAGAAVASAWVLVLEGRARTAEAPLREEAAEVPLRVVSASASGDDAIVGVVAETIARDESCLVVTADRELRQRCERLSASVAGPGWLLGLLLSSCNIDVSSSLWVSCSQSTGT
jgi:8-oxo-dGTP diphosphatase